MAHPRVYEVASETLSLVPVTVPFDSVLARILLRRGFLLWIGARVVLLLVSGGTFTPIVPLVSTSIILVAVVAALGWVDVHLWREGTLFENLGISVSLVVALYVTPAAAIETLLLVAAR